MSRLDDIANYAETHDFSAEMENGTWETDVDQDPMVSTSLRLPKSLLDWVRAEAAEQQTKPATFIRQLIERARVQHADKDSVATRLDRLERAVFPAQSTQEYIDR
jgi:hypothetical protein